VNEVRFNRRQLAAGFAGLAAATALPFSGSFAGAALAQDDAGLTLKLYLGEATNVDLNPIGVRTLGANYLQSCIYDGLVVSSPSWDEVEPALAETWEISEDGLTYTFNLRQGVTWHDGTPFTSADVLFTYKTLLTKAIGSIYATKLLAIAGGQEFYDGTATELTGVTAPDDNTVVFTLKEPFAPFVFSVLSNHSIIPEHVWSSKTAEDMAKPGTWETGQIGTGPFKFVTYEPDKFLEVGRYDTAWRGKPILDRVLFVTVGTTPEAWAAALEAGDLDFSQVPATEYERLQTVSSLVMATKPVYNVRFLSVNVAKPYLSDKRVRQAIAHAIDREGICAEILKYSSTPTNTLTPSAKWANAAVPAYAYDPEKAKALLAEAGWDANQELVLSFYYQDQPHADSMAIVQQQLTDVGIKATVNLIDGSTVQSYYYDDAEFDVLMGGFGVSPDFDEFSNVFVSTAVWPAGQNAMKYSNARVDELFREGRITSDDAARKTIYDELQVILADELPWIPFYNLQLAAGFNTRVQNGDAIFNVWNRPYNWNIEKVSVSE
jgi:peptide/nickel transport system substrate-binding protein